MKKKYINGYESLTRLINLLNTDFGSLSTKKFKKIALKRMELPGSISAEELIENEIQIEKEIYKNIQFEIKKDLIPIAAWRDIPEKIYSYFDRWFDLMERINEMNFERKWQMEKKEGRQGNFYMWNFKEVRLPSHPSNLEENIREKWYLAIAEFLEDGDLEKLGLCPICNKFFLKKRIDGHHCSNGCKRIWDNRDSFNRQARYRGRLKERNRKKEKEFKEKEEFQRFSDFVDLALKNLSDPPAGFTNMIIRIGGGDRPRAWREYVDPWIDQIKKGSSLKDVWNGISKKEKEFFAEEEV